MYAECCLRISVSVIKNAADDWFSANEKDEPLGSCAG
jgi:hypothetical protein